MDEVRSALERHKTALRELRSAVAAAADTFCDFGDRLMALLSAGPAAQTAPAAAAATPTVTPVCGRVGHATRPHPADGAAQRTDAKGRALPTDTADGLVFDDTAPKVVAQTYSVGGDPSATLQILLSGKTAAVQGRSDKDGQTTQFVSANFVAMNRTRDPITIIEARSEVLLPTGFVAAEQTKVGAYFSNEYYFQPDSAVPIVIGPQGTAEFAIEAALRTAGTPGSTTYLRRRIHPSLPNPLCVRVTLVDAQRRTWTALFEHATQPLEFSSPEYCSRALVFTYADDLKEQERCYYGVYPQGRALVFHQGGTYYTLTKSALLDRIHDAEVAGAAEFELADLRNTSGATEWRAWILVDLTAKEIYGVKLMVKTATGKSVASGLVPAAYGSAAEGFTFRVDVPGKQLTALTDFKVKYSLSAPAQSGDYISVASPEEPATAYQAYQYVTADSTEGEVEFRLKEGIYEARYICAEDSPPRIAQRSNKFFVVSALP